MYCVSDMFQVRYRFCTPLFEPIERLLTVPRKTETHVMTGKRRKTQETAEKHQKFHVKHKILPWEYVGTALNYQIHVFGKKFIKLYSLKNHFHLPPFIKNYPPVSNKYKYE